MVVRTESIHGAIVMQFVKTIQLFIALVCGSMMLVGCAGGLAPYEVTTLPGFGGTISIRSTLPPLDSLRDLRVVAFRNYPPKDIITEVSSGKAFFSDTTLPYNRMTFDYRMQQNELTGTWRYIVVAQQFGSNIFADWRVVGVYTRTHDKTKPSEVVVEENSFVDHIDIEVDFYNLPPQPF